MGEEELIKKRLEDMAGRCSRGHVFVFSPFLSMAEQDVFHRLRLADHAIDQAGWVMFGGREDSERSMIRFGREEELGYAEAFPIVCVEMAPLMQKFADELTHRDFLGALMNLGIERSTLGDIIILENKGYVFCTTVIASFIVDALERIKHTPVKCRIAEVPQDVAAPPSVSRKIQVSSERIDAVIAKTYQLSRGESLELFRQKKIYLNGISCANSSALLKPEDVVTARGFGKFTYVGYENISRKGKKNIIISVK